VAWWSDFERRLRELSALIVSTGARVSLHPGQYTVLSSEHPVVVERAIAELDYHGRLLSALGLDGSHKIVLHVGSGSADPPAASARFAAGFELLSHDARTRLVLEHDERWTLEQVLELAEPLALPVVFDAFHHQLAPSFDGLGVRAATLLAAETWRSRDGRQEVHFSTQQPGKRPGAHAASLDVDAFVSFAGAVGDLPLDCVLEVKDKEQSLLRARAAIRTGSRRDARSGSRRLR
jgi:UV DNA damage endonuclease